MDKKTILICDDDEGIVDVASIILKDAGYTVFSITSSPQIIDMVKTKHPDLILLDLWMPDLPGDEITKILKSDKKMRKIPIILVSASRNTEEVARKAGANDFITKPFDIDELESIVYKYTH